MKPLFFFMSQLLLIWQRSKISFYAFLSLVFLCLLIYNGAAIFCVNIPFPAKSPPEPASFSPEQAAESRPTTTIPTLPSPPPPPKYLNLSTLLPLLHRNRNSAVSTNRTASFRPLRPRRRRIYTSVIKILRSEKTVKKPFEFRFRVKTFFTSCKLRFFMTWISSVESFGEREMISVQSLFKAHPHGCLIIVSTSLDSKKGMQIFKPFFQKGLKITAISPDFNYLLKNTAAESWYNQLKQGNVNPGEISLGQNLSNLLRIVLLYRFGGIYLDTDIIVLRSFDPLRNSIGAQTVDVVTKKWSRLNNAVMVFDKGHPLLREFIQEFAQTFDGNRWGHNGPYLVSRVVARVGGRPGFNVTVLPPLAFYPVNWNRIGSLFEGPKSSKHEQWMLAKLGQIRSQSFAVHLWNKQSRKLEVERGSIIQHIMLSSSVLGTNSSSF